MSAQPRLYRQIFAKISEMIDSGEFPVGSRLPTERELSERFSVSRPTIREAIIALEATHKVRVKTGSGVYVKEEVGLNAGIDNEVSPFEVIEARVLLEGESAALAAKMISPEETEALREAFSKIEKEGIDNTPASADADREFHSIIAQATHNRVLANQIHALWELQENLEHIKEAHTSVCDKQGAKRISEHRAILDAIVNGKPDEARTAMQHHFSNVLEVMHAALEQQAIEAARLKGSQMRERFSIGLFSAAK